MKFIYNKFIPFKGFRLMNILGLVFTRVKEESIRMYEKVHEAIHTEQQEECLIIGAIVSLTLCNINESWWYLIGVILFPFIIYVLCWLLEIVLPPYHNAKKYFAEGSLWEKIKAIPKWITKICHDAYRDNCFEREAYSNETNSDYLVHRSHFAWLKYILKGRR